MHTNKTSYPAFFYLFIRILDAIINTWRFVIRNY